MSQTIEKQIHLTPERAERLEHLARQRGASEDVLIERALDLLFGLSGDDSYGSYGSPDSVGSFGAERHAWHLMGANALDRVWDNEADAVYDNWRELYGVPDPGEVLLVTYPYTDLTTTKARPAVVVSSDLYHREQPDLVLAGLTTNVATATGSLDYVLQDGAAAGLRFPTASKPDIVTLDPTLVVHSIGKLAENDLAEIQSRLCLAFDL